MTMLRPWLLSIAALSAMLGSTAARADDLYLGSTYNTFNFYVNNVNTTLGAGSIGNATLDGKPLAFLYCVDLFDDVNVSADYSETTYDTHGYVNGNLVANAGEIAWLLDHYAIPAEGNANAQIALQAA